MLTSYGCAVGTCFMHHVASASRLESEVHRDRGSFGAAVASKLRLLIFHGQIIFLEVSGSDWPIPTCPFLPYSEFQSRVVQLPKALANVRQDVRSCLLSAQQPQAACLRTITTDRDD